MGNGGGYRGRIKPWMVAAVLGVAGVTGAIMINQAARRQHRIDRADVIAWTARNGTALEAAQNSHAYLDRLVHSRILPGGADELHQDLVRHRRVLERGREAIISASPPRVVQSITSEYANAIFADMDALATIDEAVLAGDLPLAGPVLDKIVKVVGQAGAGWVRAGNAMRRLECRVELPVCRPPLVAGDEEDPVPGRVDARAIPEEATSS